MTEVTHAKESIVTRNEPEPTPEITRHVESADQGGEIYFRYACGREAMRRQDLTSESHADECSHQ